MKPRVTNILIPLIAENNFNVIAEVGVHRGNTTKTIVEHFENIEYYAIDPWCSYKGQGAGSLARVDQPEWDSFHQQMMVYAKGKPRLHIIRGTSVNAAGKYPDGFFDLVFIDAIHDYENCKIDIEAWLPKIRSGGVLCGHDYNKRFLGVIKAVNELLPDRKLMELSVWMYTKEGV